jgi:hypothetical protein
MPATSTAPTAPLEGTVLVRVPADDAGWVVQLPPVPTGERIGVTVGHPSVAAAHAELAARGYDLLATVGGRSPGPHADVLVPGAVRESYPRWFASLLLASGRVFDLRFGPVHVALRDELAVLLADAGLHLGQGA